MSTGNASEGTLGVVTVPASLASQVREFASSLMEEQTPDVEGYAALIGGVGAPGGSKLGPSVGAVTGSVCSVTKESKDFNCDDTD